MSLLVFGSASKVAQGVIRRLYKSGKFEKIHCADLYANYWGIQRFQYFRETLEGGESKTKICDSKIEDKSDLHHAISGSSHVLYVTHDYYANCFSKTSLLVQTANLVKQINKTKTFVSLNPVELDHYAEPNPSSTAQGSEDQAKQIYPNINQVKADLTFGPDATAVTRLVQRIVNGQSIFWAPGGGGPNPVHVDNVADVVEKLFDTNAKGEKILAAGPRVDWTNFINTLQRAFTGSGAALLNSCICEKTIPPTSNNVFSEFLYDPKYLNLVQFLLQYHAPQAAGAKDLKAFGVSPISFEDFYKSGKFEGFKYRYRTSNLEYQVQNFLY